MADEAPETQERQFPLPPPSFSFLVLSLRAQAEMQLGLMQFSEEEKTEPDLMLARHTIDLMAVLLENSVTELRFRFVQISDEAARSDTQKA